MLVKMKKPCKVEFISFEKVEKSSKIDCDRVLTLKIKDTVYTFGATPEADYPPFWSGTNCGSFSENRFPCHAVYEKLLPSKLRRYADEIDRAIHKALHNGKKCSCQYTGWGCPRWWELAGIKERMVDEDVRNIS